MMKYWLLVLSMLFGVISLNAQTTTTKTKQDTVIQKPVLKKKIVPMNRLNLTKQNTSVNKNRSNYNNSNGKQEDENGQPR